MAPELLYNNYITRWAIRKYLTASSFIMSSIKYWIPDTLVSFPFYQAYMLSLNGMHKDEGDKFSTQIWLRFRYVRLFCIMICEFNSPLKDENFYNYYLLYTWRLKRYSVFPTRYIISCMICPFLNLLKTWKTKPKLIYKPLHSSTRQNCRNDLVFPPEVWLKIAQYDVDILLLMSINKVLLDIFAPFVYNELHGIVVISSLEKMWASDECFLLNGPDVLDSGIDGYEIYLRNKESRKYAYEVLDISYNGEDFHPRYLERPTMEISETIEAGGIPFPSATYSLDHGSTIVSNYSGLECIISQIIKNPSSIMKKYVRNFSIDVMVLSDSDKFREDFNRAIGKSLSELNNYRFIAEDPDRVMVLFSGYDDFTNRRIRMRYEMKEDLAEKDIDGRICRTVPLEIRSIKKKFTTVYHKELFSVYQLFQSLLKPISKRLDRRGFEDRSSRDMQKSLVGLKRFGLPRQAYEFQFMTEVRVSTLCYMTRSLTDFAATTVEIKNRTFLCQDAFNKLCCLIGELSTKVPEEERPNCSFSLHGTKYSDFRENYKVNVFRPKYGPDTCCATLQTVILTNKEPTGNMVDENLQR